MASAPQVTHNQLNQDILQELELEKAKNNLSPGISFAFGGGVGAFGNNFTLFHENNTTIWIDCGIGFSNHLTPGLRKKLPNVELMHVYRPSTIVLTHGHEDHIGAIVHVSEIIPKGTTFYLSKFTYSLLMEKMHDNQVTAHYFNYEIIDKNQTIKVDHFDISFFFMPHSIPHAFSVGLKSSLSKKKLYFTSDFKIEGKEKRFSSKDITHFGPVDYLFCDSTGALSNGISPAENSIFKNIEQVISNTSGRVFITTFSSQIERINQIVNIAEQQQRPIGIIGYSIRAHLKAAFAAGEFAIDPENFNNPSPKNKNAIWLVAGCQADENSSFSKIVRGEKGRFDIGEGDTLVYSGSMIPGNEEAIYHALNTLSEKKVKIIGIDQSDAKMHTSGHGKKQDIVQMLQWLKPKTIVPVHGDPIHFDAFEKIVTQAGLTSTVFQASENSLFKINNKTIDKNILQNNLKCFYIEEREIHRDEQVFIRRNSIHTNGMCVIVIDKDSFKLIALNYIAVTSNNYLENILPQVKEEIALLAQKTFNSTSAKKDKRLKDKIYKLNRTTFGKNPFVELILI